MGHVVFKRIAAESVFAGENPPEFMFCHNPVTGAHDPRAIYIDMEPRVLDRLLGSDENARRWSVSDQAGSGNNWARGYHEHGSQHIEIVEELIRQQVERCDVCDGVIFFGSTSGGTGSGLGSRILEMTRDRFDGIPLIPIYVVSSPNHADVVITPYNELFTISTFNEYAHVVIPVDNQALARISEVPFKGCLSYNGINHSIASFVSCLTSPMCFPDLADIPCRLTTLKTNLVGSDSRKLLVPSHAAIDTERNLDSVNKQFDNMFSDLGKYHKNRLLSIDRATNGSRNTVERICGFGVITRVRAGPFSTEDVIRRLHDVKRGLRIHELRSDLVSHVSLKSTRSAATLVGLQNTSKLSMYLRRVKAQVHRLLDRRSHIHHYTDCMDVGDIEFKFDGIKGMITAYEEKL